MKYGIAGSGGFTTFPGGLMKMSARLGETQGKVLTTKHRRNAEENKHPVFYFPTKGGE